MLLQFHVDVYSNITHSLSKKLELLGVRSVAKLLPGKRRVMSWIPGTKGPDTSALRTWLHCCIHCSITGNGQDSEAPQVSINSARVKKRWRISTVGHDSASEGRSICVSPDQGRTLRSTTADVTLSVISQALEDKYLMISLTDGL